MSTAEDLLRKRLAQGLDTPWTQAVPTPRSQVPSRTGQVCVSPIVAWNRFWKNWGTDGRASRSEYWWAMLWITLLLCLFSFIAALIICMNMRAGDWGTHVTVFDILFSRDGFMNFYYWDFLIVSSIPWLGLMVRRLHDAGFRGWFSLIWILPTFLCATIPNCLQDPPAMLPILQVLFFFAAGITSLVVMCLPSQQHANRYGPVPNVPEES